MYYLSLLPPLYRFQAVSLREPGGAQIELTQPRAKEKTVHSGMLLLRYYVKANAIPFEAITKKGARL
jgi:hypothetical protein